MQNTNHRLLDIDGVINFRDLGGYQGIDGAKVAWNKIYRSAQLDRPSNSGIQRLRDLGVKTVVDLRFEEETQRYPTVVEAFPDADFVTWYAQAKHHTDDPSTLVKRSWKEGLESGDPLQVRRAMRENYPLKLYSHQGVYREMLLRLIEDQGPLVFHCAAGKDRTGVAAAMILSLLGVSEQDIVQDYLISQSQVANLLDTWAAGGATGEDQYDDFQQKLAQYPRSLVQPVFDADVAYINTLIEYVDQRYGNFQNYAIKTLQLQPQELALFRERLLV